MTLAGALVGALLGLLAAPAVRRLPLGIPERIAQPAWTRRAGAPPVLVAVGTAAGAALGAAAADPAALALGLALLAVLLPATAIDLAWRVVPDTLVVLGSVASLAVVAATGGASAVGGHLVAAAVGGGCALAVAIAARGGFGLGDVKLIALAGLALGPALPLAAIAALGLAGAVALPVLAVRGRGATLPLAPFLAAGILLASAYGDMAAIPL